LRVDKSVILALILVVVNLTTFWIYRIFSQEFLIGIILIIISFWILFVLNNKVSRKVFLLGIFGFLLLTFFIVFSNFDQNLLAVAPIDKDAMTIRQSYYRTKVAQIVENRVTLFSFKYEKNIFTNLSFNQFFFGGAPRYRSFALDFEKYPLIDLVFFLYGLFILMKINFAYKKGFIILTTVTLLLLGFLNTNYNLGPAPLYPLITAVIALGVYEILEKTGAIKNV
jgi:hypothetical protein